MLTDKLILLHPLLFSIIFVIMPFTQYAGLIPPGQIVLPLIAVCAFSLLLYFLIKLIVKKAGTSVALLSPLLIVFCNYGTLYEYISSYTSGTYLKGIVLAATSIIILFALIFYIIKSLRFSNNRIAKINKVFCIIAGILLIFNAYSITMQAVAYAKINGTLNTKNISIYKQPERLPDIYFIVLDEYAAPSQMKSYFNHDMSPFVNFLNQKGFMTTEMITNSLSTASILEARLNIIPVKRHEGKTSSGSFLDIFLQSMNILNAYEEERMIRLRNNKVVNYLKTIGYQYIHMGSWFAQTRYNQLADKNYNFYGLQFKDELPAIIASNSLLRLFFINKYFVRRSVLDAFDTLENMTVILGKPKFVFAHIICPHTPYVFGPNGEKLSTIKGQSGDSKKLYIDQHIFITKKVKELVERKLSSNQTAPVIIIQADHGARMDKPGAHKVFSAVYIPKHHGKLWPEGTNSVNTFRFIFNELFGTNLEIL